MLRLRLPTPLSVTLTPGVPRRAILAVDVWATNESGSIVKLLEDLTLSATLVDATTLLPLRGYTLAPPPQLRLAARGQCTLQFTLVMAAGSVGVPPFRLRLEAARSARVLPLSASFQGGGSQSAGAPSAPAQACQPVLLAVAAVCSAAWPPPDSRARAAHSGAAPSLPPLAAALCEVVAFPRAEAGGGAAELRLFEQQMAIAPGFGAIVWDSALLLCAVLAANGAALRGRRCVDVGSGTAVVALAAGSVGAHVLATDLPLQLPLMELNAAANAAMVARSGGSVRCASLPWGVAVRDGAAIAAWGAQAEADSAGAGLSCGGVAPAPSTPSAPPAAGASRTSLLQAADGGLLPPYDWVLASEVAYRQELLAPLLNTLRALCGPHTVVLLAARQRACYEIPDFLSAATVHFRVVQLAGEAVACEGVEPLPPPPAPPARRGPPRAGEQRGAEAQGTSVPLPPALRALQLPPHIGAFSTGAAALSKTSWAPLLFALVLKT